MGKGKSREIIEEKIQMINTCGEMLKQQWAIMLHWLEQQIGESWIKPSWQQCQEARFQVPQRLTVSFIPLELRRESKGEYMKVGENKVQGR